MLRSFHDVELPIYKDMGDGQRAAAPSPTARKRMFAHTPPSDLVAAARRSMAGFMTLQPERLPDGRYRLYMGHAELPVPRMSHAQWDCGDATGRAIDAWGYVRRMTQDLETGRGVEEGQRKFLLSILSPQSGLVFVPELSDLKTGRLYFHIWDQGRTLRALVRWYMSVLDDRREREKLEGHVRKMIQGLRGLAQFGADPLWGEYAIYQRDDYYSQGPPPPKTGPSWVTRAGQLIEPMAMYAEISDDPQVLDFAVKLTHGALSGREHIERGANAGGAKGGRFGAQGEFNGHFHTHASLVLGVVKLGAYLIRRGKREEGRDLILWSKRVYDWILDQERNFNAGGTFGWFPENVEATEVGQVSELCSVADMIELAAALARCAALDTGFKDYSALWDDVTRFTVNGFLARQFQGNAVVVELWKHPPELSPKARDVRSSSLSAGGALATLALAARRRPISRRKMLAVAGAGLMCPLPLPGRAAPAQGNVPPEEVLRRAEGSWIDACYPNDLITYKDEATIPGIKRLYLQTSGCCAYSGPRGLHACWESIVSRSGRDVFVNMPLTRKSDWASVEIRDDAPRAEQTVKLSVFDAPRLHFRVPSWGKVQDAKITVNGKPYSAKPPQENRYILFDGLSKGDSVEVTLPTPVVTSQERVGGNNSSHKMVPPADKIAYKLTWRANRVVNMEPQGMYLPLFSS